MRIVLARVYLVYNDRWQRGGHVETEIILEGTPYRPGYSMFLLSLSPLMALPGAGCAQIQDFSVSSDYVIPGSLGYGSQAAIDQIGQGQYAGGTNYRLTAHSLLFDTPQQVTFLDPQNYNTNFNNTNNNSFGVQDLSNQVNLGNNNFDYTMNQSLNYNQQFPANQNPNFFAFDNNGINSIAGSNPLSFDNNGTGGLVFENNSSTTGSIQESNPFDLSQYSHDDLQRLQVPLASSLFNFSLGGNGMAPLFQPPVFTNQTGPVMSEAPLLQQFQPLVYTNQTFPTSSEAPLLQQQQQLQQPSGGIKRSREQVPLEERIRRQLESENYERLTEKCAPPAKKKKLAPKKPTAKKQTSCGFLVDNDGTLFFSKKPFGSLGKRLSKLLSLDSDGLLSIPDAAVFESFTPTADSVAPYSQVIFKAILSGAYRHFHKEGQYPYDLPPRIDLINGMILLGHFKFYASKDDAKSDTVPPKLLRAQNGSAVHLALLKKLFVAMHGPLDIQTPKNTLYYLTGHIMYELVFACGSVCAFDNSEPARGLLPENAPMAVWRFYQLFVMSDEYLTRDILPDTADLRLPNYHHVHLEFVRRYLLDILGFDDVAFGLEQLKTPMSMEAVRQDTARLIAFMESLEGNACCHRRHLHLLLSADQTNNRSTELTHQVALQDEQMTVRLMSAFVNFMQRFGQDGGMSLVHDDTAFLTRFEGALIQQIAAMVQLNYNPVVNTTEVTVTASLKQGLHSVLEKALDAANLQFDADLVEEVKLGEAPIKALTRIMNAPSFPIALCRLISALHESSSSSTTGE